MFRVVVMNDGEGGYLAEAQPLTPLAEGRFAIDVYEWRGQVDELGALMELWGLRDADASIDGSGFERMKTQLDQTGSFTIGGSFEANELTSHGFTSR